MAKIIAVANEKGGVGKTTTVANTAYALAELGFKTLVIDFDPQNHLTVSLGFSTPEELDTTLTDAIRMFANHHNIDENLIRNSILKVNNIDLYPSNRMLGDYEYVLRSLTDGEYVLTDILKIIENDYDYILIDCMSSWGIYTINALVAANSIIIPTEPHYLSSNGLQLILYNVKAVQKRLNPKLKIDGILITKSQKNTRNCKDIIRTIKEDFGEFFTVFDTIIPLATKVAEAPKNGMTVIEYKKNDAGSIAYQNFAKELSMEWQLID